MTNKARTYISTSVFNKTYLKRAWQTRNELAPYERRGFAQFFFLTICGHLESLIARLIELRLRSIRMMLHWEKLGPMEYTHQGVKHQCSLQPLVESLFGLLDSTNQEVEQSAIERLRRIYSKVFTGSLDQLVGQELTRDLNALLRLRNLFAHGRDLYMELEGFPESIGVLDGNPLQLPAQRLYQAGIIKNFDITGQNSNEFQEHFYTDDALLYFYDRVLEIEAALRGNLTFMPESAMLHMMDLPDLRAEQTDQSEN